MTEPPRWRHLGDGMGRILLFTAGIVLTASASAVNYRPMVDDAAIRDRGLLEQDISACQAYADRLSPAGNAAGGAVAGAIIGAALGAALGNSSTARFGAGYGAVSGAAGSAGGTYAMQVNIVRNCMMGRGYMVLDAPNPGFAGGISPAYTGESLNLSRKCQIAPGADGCEAEIADAKAASAAKAPAQVASVDAATYPPATETTDTVLPSAKACLMAPGLIGCERRNERGEIQ